MTTAIMKPVKKISGNLGSIAALSFSQKQSILVSWRLMRSQANATFRKILIELEVASPKVKQIFYKAALVDAFNKDDENSATLEVHIRLIAKFFDDLIANLENEAECLERIKRVGQVHAVLARSCGFSSDIWERLGEIAMERICTHESIQKTREAARAWRTLIACIVDELRNGFEGEARIHRKSSNSLERVESDSSPTEDLGSKMRQLRVDFEPDVSYEDMKSAASMDERKDFYEKFKLCQSKYF